MELNMPLQEYVGVLLHKLNGLQPWGPELGVLCSPAFKGLAAHSTVGKRQENVIRVLTKGGDVLE